jgi:hypothetical protein
MLEAPITWSTDDTGAERDSSVAGAAVVTTTSWERDVGAAADARTALRALVTGGAATALAPCSALAAEVSDGRLIGVPLDDDAVAAVVSVEADADEAACTRPWS